MEKGSDVPQTELLVLEWVEISNVPPIKLELLHWIN
jgi:hypothetical protein